eukprot:TRINITY_DN11145_c0_g1_i2.p1 TRINITY_DN11145_c0_g1~~TRINITY_DN11145_c0_g1_i2.p1  ORF type:complete len:129 (+),score=11.79 TRINITY_DN11145_c0_g1_i2:303-689(+)
MYSSPRSSISLSHISCICSAASRIGAVCVPPALASAIASSSMRYSTCHVSCGSDAPPLLSMSMSSPSAAVPRVLESASLCAHAASRSQSQQLKNMEQHNHDAALIRGRRCRRGCGPVFSNAYTTRPWM